MIATLHGVVVVDKPLGPTSHDVVAAVRRRVRPSRTGHTGTLDPMATGVLPVCVGAATRLSRYLTRGPKIYEGRLQLGVITDTYDARGLEVERRPVGDVSRERLAGAAAGLTGDLMQAPPPWSAKKIGGKRAYRLAREGAAPAPAPCPVRVERFEIGALEEDAVPFLVECSTGTYVRSLVHDLGLALGCGAHLSALRRVRSGPFTLEGALELGRVEAGDGRQAVAAALIPLEALDLGMPTARLTEAGAGAARHGRPVPPEEAALAPGPSPAGPVRLLGPDGSLLGVGEQGPGPGRPLLPRVILAGAPAGRP